MGTVTTLPRSRPFTRRDLDRMPDDGRRYEIVDGSLVVSPSPSRRHQRVSARLHALLADAAPQHLVALFAPIDVVLAEDTVFQPDLLVARTAEFDKPSHPVRPVLVVEILSPSTRRIDVSLKRDRFEAAGCPSYWAVDPDAPSLTAWDLHGGRYVEVARVEGEEEFTAVQPYPVVVTPARLLD